MSDELEESPQLPQQLVNDLRAAYLGSGGRDISPAVDRAVLATFRREKRMGRRYRWVSWAAVAAAVAVVAGGVAWHERESSGAAAYAQTGDIRDAFYLARQLAAGHGAASGTWDKNGDGVVNQDDVRALALAAVALPAGGKP